MSTIPTIDSNEHFVSIEEEPGYYISNYKRIYSIKTNKFMTIYQNSCFKNSYSQKICIKPLYNKYFNQPNEENLIAIIRYGNHKFQNLYYDRTTDKFYKLKDGTYIEIEQRTHSKARTDKVIYVYDNNGKNISLAIKKFKKTIEV